MDGNRDKVKTVLSETRT